LAGHFTADILPVTDPLKPLLKRDQVRNLPGTAMTRRRVWTGDLDAIFFDPIAAPHALAVGEG